MNKLTNDSNNNSNNENTKDTATNNNHNNTNDNNNNVITDKENSLGFEVDWDTIEKNYRYSRRHRHHHSQSQTDDGTNTSSADNVSEKNSNPKKKHKVRNILIGILLFLLCIIIGIAAAFMIMRYQGKKALLNYDNLNINVPEGIDYTDNGRTIYYNGHTYEFNSNIATVLFMGIDNRELQEGAAYGTAGQADALYLFTYDTGNGKIRVLCLNRDTMTDISRYDSGGNFYDTAHAQLCLAYAYGDGKKVSANNQVTAVERLLYNVPINAYYAIDLSVIKILNDDIGGVTVTPEYSFTDFTKGQQVTLKGDMAESFVRYRDVSLLDDNLRRMDCQRQYINAFTNQIVPAIRNDFGLPSKLYKDSSEYTVTDIGISDITYLASSLAFQYSGLELITTTGEYKDAAGDDFAEYIVDKTKLFETVLDIFYIQTK
jgi:LCP family protein required for cell wall assembly